MVKLDQQKFKTITKVLAIELGQEIKKEEARDQGLILEIQKQLQQDKVDSAKLKAGEIVRIRNRKDIYDILKLFVEQMQYDLPLMQRSDNVPETMAQNFHSIIYATNTIATKYLLELADLLKKTYGKQFYETAKSESSLAPQDFKQKVMFHQPSSEQIDLILAEVVEYDQRSQKLMGNYNQYLQKKNQNDNDPNGNNTGSGFGGTPAGNNGEDDDLAQLRARLNRL